MSARPFLSSSGVPAFGSFLLCGQDVEIETIVRRGRGPMPGFARLAETDVQLLIAFLLDPSRAAAVPSVPAAPRGPEAKSAPDSGAVRYLSGFGFMMTSTGVPPIAPPWASLTAYDLNKGTIKWKIPLGEVPEMAAKGIRDTGFPFP